MKTELNAEQEATMQAAWNKKVFAGDCTLKTSFNAFLDGFHAALSQPQGEPVASMDGDESREYLISFMNRNFTDTTFTRYIRKELAGDFAWQIANSIARPFTAPPAPYVDIDALTNATFWRENVAQSIHYPDCWDTAAYPTVESALVEIGAFRCSECTAPPAPAQPVPLSDGQFLALRDSIKPEDGWDGDDWDLALRNAIEKHHGILATQETK